MPTPAHILPLSGAVSRRPLSGSVSRMPTKTHSEWVKLVQVVLQPASTMLPHLQSALTSNKACALATQLAPLALHGLLLKLTRLAVNSRLLCGCLCCLLLLAGSSLLGFPLLVDLALLGSLFL